MSTRKTQLDAVWAAYSFCRLANFSPKIHFVVDPEPENGLGLAMKKLFKNSELYAGSKFRKTNFGSATSQFCQLDRFGGKVAAILELSKKNNLFYFDSDVLFFQRPKEIIDHINSRSPFYMVSGGGLEWACPKILEHMSLNGIMPIVGFNSGIMFFPKGMLNSSIFEDALQIIDGVDYNHFTEQTLFNQAFAQKSSKSLNRKRYSADGDHRFIFSNDLNYSDLVARHFVGPVRHQLYMRGMPVLRSNCIF
jgi:hypothetical protein